MGWWHMLINLTLGGGGVRQQEYPQFEPCLGSIVSLQAMLGL